MKGELIMKNCPKCNVELNDDVLVCPECGENLAVEAAPAKKVSPLSTISLVLAIASIVLGALCCVVVGFLFGTIGVIACCTLTTMMAIAGIVLGAIGSAKGGNKLGLILSIIAVVLGIIVYPAVGAVCGVIGYALVSEILYEIM